jgi:flagellar motor protein MotB
VDGNWTKAAWVQAPISTKINDACIGISADGQTMFLFKSSNNGDIFISHLDGENWTEPEGLPTNSPQRETSACISPDGNTIYFVRKNNVNSDIYYIRKMPSGNWTTAKRLSSMVNSSLDEESPYMHPDGKTLYFSSKGHGTMGGYDVFKTVKTDTGWTKPVNLGYPINTAGDDWSFVLSADGYKGFYASVKKRGYGKQDLYSLDFKKPEVSNLTLVKGTIKSEKGHFLQAEITITSLSDNEVINKTYSNKATGEYLVLLPKGQDYGIQVIEDSSLIFSKNFSLSNDEGYNEEIINVELKSIKKGATFTLENILFETAKAELKAASSLELNQLVLVLEKNKKIKIEITGHTDNVGSVEVNQKLSETRA